MASPCRHEPDHQQSCAIAAPQSGKTSGLVTPALLERERMGEVFVWDPFGKRTDCWDPLQGGEA